MAEHWKSTPKYYCKPCLTYVRDTPLERTNHEATGKHKGAIRRALGNLHRAANTAQREQEQARREIDRVNGVVNNSIPHSTSSSTSRASGSGSGSSEAERARQAAQLAALGVAPPAAFRADLAMPGEWSVTSTTIVDDETAADGKKTGGDGGGANKLKARGVHKRERTDAEREHEAAVEGLFKRPRKWGRDTRHAGGGEESGELDALLSGGLELGVKKEEKEEGKDVPAKIEADDGEQDGRVKEEEGAERPVVKEEPVVEDGNAGCIPADVPVADVKAEGPGADLPRGVENKDGEAGSGATADAPVVVAFKKRKPKNIRQR